MPGINDRQKPSIGVMSVATNIYFEYWKKMVQSADERSAETDRITFFVFTEQIQDLEAFSKTLLNVSVEGFQVSPYGWPDATILRYKIFSDHLSTLNTDVLMHLDADMIFVTNPWNEIRQLIAKKRICLIRHPGFWRSQGLERVLFYLKNPLIAYKDLRMKISVVALGAWEMNEKSVAFVPRELRNLYFCGGNWFGPRDAIAEMLLDLSERVQTDEKRGIMATWHDESHLNKWATQNEHLYSSPEFCFDETYPQLKNLKPRIIAVRKKEKTR